MSKKKRKVVEGPSNNEQLADIMARHKLGRRDVAYFVGYSIAKNGQAYTVNNWLTPPKANGFRPMPDTALMLLKLRVKGMTKAERENLQGPLDKAAIIEENRKKRKCFLSGNPAYRFKAA